MPRIDPKLLPSIGDRNLPGVIPVNRGGTGSNTGSHTGSGSIVLQTSPTVITPIIQGLLSLTGTSAGQIKFPATENPSTDPNTLDDYEEGSWVPTFTTVTIVGTPTYNAQYIKIGKLVVYEIFLTATTSVSTTTASECTNFPFTVPVGFFPCIGMSDDLLQTGIGLGTGSGSMIFLPAFTPTSKINICGFTFVSA